MIGIGETYYIPCLRKQQVFSSNCPDPSTFILNPGIFDIRVRKYKSIFVESMNVFWCGRKMNEAWKSCEY